jgi:hypothetical protein
LRWWRDPVVGGGASFVWQFLLARHGSSIVSIRRADINSVTRPLDDLPSEAYKERRNPTGDLPGIWAGEGVAV